MENSTRTVEKLSWPDLVGTKGEEAIAAIMKENPLLKAHTVHEGSLVTCDFRSDRPSRWCGMSAGRGQKSARHGPKMPAEKKSKTYSTACEGPLAVERPVINMTSSNGRKNEAARSEPVEPAIGLVMPSMPKSVPRHPLGAKSNSSLERLDIMKSDKMDSAAKVVLRPTPSVAETDSPAGKEEIACVGSFEKSTKPVSGEVAEICVLLKPYVLKDMDACANKAAKEVVKTMAAEAYSSAEEIKRLDSELVALKGLKKEVDELQCVRVEDLLAFTFEASIGEVVEEVALDDAAAKSVTAVKVDDHLVGCFGLPIALRISWRGHVLLDAILLEELLLYVRMSYGHFRLCFYPFCEIVNCHDHHASAPNSRRHKSYQVDYLMHERPRTLCGCSSLAGSAGIGL
ncbi:hypothetical protein D8674_010046 [Pyrus ussuriensis x Pyrus communis]|uniref:Uncharacterized protein n=1 Tax=Pyrus ussuriensis x Pyrus communis TaxID=2448454 RepID=A0A5N5F9P9_9ROSA|nr:hypothetical protein D8674_010046 [Pyrus ussuriensis x Pyrus communis]